MIINGIEKNSIADRMGLQIDDQLEAINGHKINDIIDYRFFASDGFLKIKIIRRDQILQFEIEKEIDEELGLSFAPITYRCCGNNCIFCFVDQNPPRLRPNLYFKDEDFRLSFLHGNYVTLTHVTKSDLKRIVNQRLSPLYISVHAMDKNVRMFMLGQKRDDHLQEKIQYLADHQIELHAQIVLCPTINDGPNLEYTISELSKFYPHVASVAIVPVGLTKYRQHLYPLIELTIDYAVRIIEAYEPVAHRFKSEFGSYFIYLADEFYLTAGRPLPNAERYEDYYQYENGIGMMRYFMDQFLDQQRSFPKKLNTPCRMAIVTAELAQPFLENTVLPALNSIAGLDVSLVVVRNQFFGTTVKVTGLLTGSDIFNQLIDHPPVDFILLPANCLNHEGYFLDDWTVALLSQRLNQPVHIAGIDFSELFALCQSH